MNYGRYIEQCIQSVLSQKASIPTKINHIIMDGGSTDETIKILKKYEGRIHYYVNRGEGQTPALNHAMRIIEKKFPKTKYLGWINADDYYNPCWLEASLSVLRKEPRKTAMICGYVTQVGVPDFLKAVVKEHERVQDTTPLNPYINAQRMTRGNYVLQPTVLIRMYAFKAMKRKYGYWFNPEYDYTQDLELWHRFLANGLKIRRIRDRVATLRRHPIRMSQTHRVDQRREGHRARVWLIDQLDKVEDSFKIAFMWRVRSSHIAGFWENKRDSHQNAMYRLSEQYKVRLFVSWDKEKPRGVWQGQDITYHPYSKPDLLLKQLKAFNPDMIFMNMVGEGAWVSVIEEFPNAWKALIDYGNRRMILSHPEQVDAVIVQQQHQKNKALRNNKIAPKKVKVIPFCIETDHFKPMPVGKLYTGVMVADFRENIKRQYLLIKAWPQIPGRLLLIGRYGRSLPKGYHNVLMKLAASLGVENRITFMNGCPYQAMPNIISMAKIGYLTSSREGGSRALLEKMACGLPCIVMKDCEGAVNMVKNGVEGYVANPLKRGDIAAKTKLLLKNYRSMGKAASRRVRKDYPYNRMSDEYQKLVEEVIERRR